MASFRTCPDLRILRLTSRLEFARRRLFSTNFPRSYSVRTGRRFLDRDKIAATERFALASGAAVGAFFNPNRADLVAILGETTGQKSLEQLRNRMKMHATGKKILEAKPRISTSSINVQTLLQMKEDSLGYHYGHFLQEHGFNPDERPGVNYIEDTELAYIITRYREIHDFGHIICGLPPTVPGEIALKWFEMAQTNLPMTALSAFVGPLRLPSSERAQLRQFIFWACECGPDAELLLNVWFENHLEDSLCDIQKMIFGEYNFSRMPKLS